MPLEIALRLRVQIPYFVNFGRRNSKKAVFRGSVVRWFSFARKGQSEMMQKTRRHLQNRPGAEEVLFLLWQGKLCGPARIQRLLPISRDFGQTGISRIVHWVAFKFKSRLYYRTDAAECIITSAFPTTTWQKFECRRCECAHRKAKRLCGRVSSSEKRNAESGKRKKNNVRKKGHVLFCYHFRETNRKKTVLRKHSRKREIQQVSQVPSLFAPS